MAVACSLAMDKQCDRLEIECFELVEPDVSIKTNFGEVQ